MKVAFLDLRRQHHELRREVEQAVAGVFQAGRFIGGRHVEEFERAFAAFCGAREAVGVASGTAAIELTLRALGIGTGDEVITAANTCVPTVAGIEAAGATPVLVDVDEATLTIDPHELAEATTPRTKAIVVVHLYGQCADMDAIGSHARENGLAVVEDAAQAHGADFCGRRAGTLGTAAAFSFYPTKNLGAAGDAGAVVTDEDGVADTVRELRSFGERRGGPALRRGRNSRLDALQAAILATKLPRLEGWNRRRRALAASYLEGLGEAGLRLPEEAAGRSHVYHLFVVRSPARDVLAGELAKRGVQTVVHYPRAVHEHPAYGDLARPGRLGRSERSSREVLSLPLYPELGDDEIRGVVDAVLDSVRRG
jgi:dTDP-3-amino-3,4,6-trideoxy-alpha-D-glucose transaminase